MMRQFLAKRVCQARQTANLHSHGQVAAFHKASRDMARIRIPHSHFGYNPLDWTWGVPPVGAVVLAEIAEQFRKLREVRVQSEGLRNGILVVSKSIGRNLRAAFDAVVQIPQKLIRVRTETLAHMECGNQFSLGIDSDKHPLIADLGSVNLPDAAILFAHESPNLIDLQIPGPKVAHTNVHQSGAALTGHDEQAHDRVAVESGKAFRGADRAAFDKTGQRTRCRVGPGHERIACQSFVGFREAHFTGSAFPALNAPFAEGSSFHADRVLASDTGHGLFSACVEREKPYNRFGSGLRLTPRFGLAPQPVSAGSGALNVEGYLARWLNGNYHRGTVGSEGDLNRDLHCIPPFSCRSVLQALSGSYLKSFILLRDRAKSRHISTRKTAGSARVASSLFQLHRRMRSRSLPCFSAVLNGFTRISLFRKAIQNCVDRRKRIGVLCQTSAKFVQFLSHVARCERIARCGDDPTYIVRQGGINKLAHTRIGEIREVLVLPLMLRDQDSKRIHRFSERQNPLLDLTLLVQQIFKFSRRLLVGFVIGLVCHQFNLSRS